MMGLFVSGDRKLPVRGSPELGCSPAVSENHSGAAPLIGSHWSTVSSAPSGLGPDALLCTSQGPESDLLLLKSMLKDQEL